MNMNVRDLIWFCDADGTKMPARVTRADQDDAETVDVAMYIEFTDEAGITHAQIHGGHAGAKQAKTPEEQKTPGHWWVRS